MEYLKKKIFNKTQIALTTGINKSLFDAKLHQRNYNRFNTYERDLIAKKLAEMLKKSDLNRVMLIDFVEIH